MVQRILIADADPARRGKIAGRVSRIVGTEVAATAGSPAQALSTIRSTRFDAVVLGSSCASDLAVLSEILSRARLVILAHGASEDRLRLDHPGAAIVPADASDATLRTALFGPAPRGARPPPGHAGGGYRFKPGKLILIGASTGGVDALVELLSAFPARCPATAIVQHTGSGFSEGLVRLLDAKTAPTVCEAADGLEIRTGRIVIARADAHLELARAGGSTVCRLSDAPPVNGHRPSVDVLFRSARHCATRAAAAILTGMGRDGADGLLELRKAGARTFGQDSESSVVYGMPRAAAEIGAVERQLPLSRIADALLSACSEEMTA